MPTEKKPLTAASQDGFTPLPDFPNPDELFPTRDPENKKIEVIDLFTHFTASIIREDVTFTR